MNVSELILDDLKKKGKVAISKFGVFSLENIHATIDTQNKSILPPSKRIVFFKNTETDGREFQEFVVEKKKVSQEYAEFLIQSQTDFWNKRMEAKTSFFIKDLGSFEYLNEGFVFLGERIGIETPEFFGLEEINFSEIKKAREKRSGRNKGVNYRFNNSILWFFLFIIPILGLVYLAITEQELLFGKKSFPNVSVTNSTHRIEDQPFVVDSLIAKPSDSLQTKKE